MELRDPGTSGFGFWASDGSVEETPSVIQRKHPLALASHDELQDGDCDTMG